MGADVIVWLLTLRTHGSAIIDGVYLLNKTSVDVLKAQFEIGRTQGATGLLYDNVVNDVFTIEHIDETGATQSLGKEVQ